MPASFFGEKIAKEVIAYYDYTQTRIYCLRLNSKNVLDLIYCVRKIESIDEVLGVSLYKTAFPLNDTIPNDPWYLSSTDDEVGQWALDVIEIEKVWDFSKGVNKINVGVIDSGVYSHDDLPNGIIFLVDEDIEAYENGTLVFYDKGNVPQVQ